MKVLVYTKNGKGETTYKRTVEVKPTVRAIRALFRKHEEGMDFESRMNFGDNALYYSIPKSDIMVELTYNEKRVELTVKDTGIGVTEDEQNRLFTKFYRASNARKQRPDGTGVGLATTGVGAGTYTKVTVDTFGRVITGATATPADIGGRGGTATRFRRGAIPPRAGRVRTCPSLR